MWVNISYESDNCFYNKIRINENNCMESFTPFIWYILMGVVLVGHNWSSSYLHVWQWYWPLYYITYRLLACTWNQLIRVYDHILAHFSGADLVTQLIWGSVWVWAQPMCDDVTMSCHLLLAEPIRRMIIVIVEADVLTILKCNSIGKFFWWWIGFYFTSHKEHIPQIILRPNLN